MSSDLNGYTIRKSASGNPLSYDGLKILEMDGANGKGKAVNVYNKQWINSQTEDFMITTTDSFQAPVIIRENMDIEVSFIIHKKYGATNVVNTHTQFINDMTGSDVWITSPYAGTFHCVCLEKYKPTTKKKSYIMGKITMHVLEAPTSNT